MSAHKSRFYVTIVDPRLDKHLEIASPNRAAAFDQNNPNWNKMSFNDNNGVNTELTSST